MFSDQKVNSGRQVELDFAKCMSIVFMIFLHCLMVTSAFKYDVSVYMQKGIGQLLGEPFAAPVFMFSMGFGTVYSRNQDPDYLIKRGIKMMLLGIVVNIGEFFIPHYLAGYLLSEEIGNNFPIAGGLLLFCIDILAFAGMAMIMMGLFKKLNMSGMQMVGAALVLSALGSYFRFTDFGSAIPNLIAGYFIGSGGGFTAFPLFNWLIIPAAGVCFAEYYIRCTDKKKLLRAWPAALVLAIACFVASWSMPEGFLSETHHYYFMTTSDAVFCLINIYGVIGFWHAVSGLLPEGIVKACAKLSGNVDVIYIVQWFLIPITYIFICYFNRGIVFGDGSLVIISLLELTVAAAIASLYKNFKKKYRKQ